MEEQFKKEVNWSKQQHLVYQIFVLLHSQPCGSKERKKKFSKLAQWLKWIGKIRTKEQCRIHHIKMVKRAPKGQYVEFLLHKNYTLRQLHISHINNEVKGHFRQIMEKEKGIKVEFQNLVKAFVSTCESSEYKKEEINKKEEIQVQANPLELKKQKNNQLVDQNQENRWAQIERYNQWFISSVLVEHKSVLSD